MMLLRFTRFWVAMGLLVLVWGLSTLRRLEPAAVVHPIGTPPGPVRIVQFYASVRILTAGDKALLCYSVQNARSVRIAPISQEVHPPFNRCVEIVPQHTTHYTILAEGYDGKIAVRSLILPVEVPPTPWQMVANRNQVGQSFSLPGHA